MNSDGPAWVPPHFDPAGLVPTLRGVAEIAHRETMELRERGVRAWLDKIARHRWQWP